MQYAYWIGRGEKQILGGVSCHAYFEFKGLGLDTDKLKEAWYKIQQRHPMLRARFLENGTQQIIEQNKFSNELIIYDLREKQSEIEEHLLKIRTTNSHRIFDIEKGHVAALEVTIINNKEYPGIISSVVDVVGIKESKKIYAYIISRQKKLDFKSIEQFLKSYLPEYMIPSKFVMGEKIPLSLNGKVERSYVSRILEENLNVESVDYEEPIGTTETTISLIWKKVLKIEKLSRNDDFFEVGGDSLKAVSIMSQLKQKNLVPINTSVQILFTNSTIKKFAEQVNRLNMEENQETEIDTI